MKPGELDELIRVRVALGESQKSVAKDLGVGAEWRKFVDVAGVEEDGE